MILEPSFLAQLDRLALATRRMRAGSGPGERRSPQRGGSIEFADFRTYAPGDDFRQIDWNAYARLERLFLKLFVAEEDLTVHLLLDGSQSMAGGSPEKWGYARRLAAGLGYLALTGFDRLTGAVLSQRGVSGGGLFRPLRGRRQAPAWFDWLLEQAPGGMVTPARALGDYVAQARHPGLLFVISDLLGPGWEAGLRTLAGRRYEIVVLHVLSPQEISPPLEGDVRLVDSETGAAVEVTADHHVLARYRARLAAWQDHLRRLCGALDAQYVLFDTTLPLEALVLTTLRRHTVIR